MTTATNDLELIQGLIDEGFIPGSTLDEAAPAVIDNYDYNLNYYTKEYVHETYIYLVKKRSFIGVSQKTFIQTDSPTFTVFRAVPEAILGWSRA